MRERYQTLIDRLEQIPQAPYPLGSRIHSLRSFSFPATHCFIKREDELGFGVSGSKIRKYRSLIPFLCQSKIKEVVLLGSRQSNHLLSCSQLLIENGFSPTLFLRGDPKRPLQGNALLTSLFIPSTSIHWYSKENWKAAESEAYLYAKKQSHPTFVIPEGGFVAECLPGALTLPLEIYCAEQEKGIHFDHLFIEAGTGFMASALLLGLSWLQRPLHVHVILLADRKTPFLNKLMTCHQLFESLMKHPLPLPSHFTLHTPLLTGQFGQIKPLIFQSIAQLAREEGFLTDPIYTAKLFIEGRSILVKGNIKGNVLFIHSGGALTLSGFQEQLQKFK